MNYLGHDFVEYGELKVNKSSYYKCAICNIIVLYEIDTTDIIVSVKNHFESESFSDVLHLSCSEVIIKKLFESKNI